MKVVAFTLHQRPFYTRQVLDAWLNVRGVEDWYFVFHIDPSSQTAEQANICDEFAQKHPKTKTYINVENLGVLTNPYVAMSSAFHEFDASFAVLAEEDVLPARDVLEYFAFAETQNVMAACAWSDRDGEPFGVSYRKWFNPWLWGTSFGQWERHIAPTWDFDYSSADDRGPGGWDCNLGLRVVNDRDLKVLFPHASRSQHIGKWLGTHQDPNQFGEQEEPSSFVLDREPVEWRVMRYLPHEETDESP